MYHISWVDGFHCKIGLQRKLKSFKVDQVELLCQLIHAEISLLIPAVFFHQLSQQHCLLLRLMPIFGDSNAVIYAMPFLTTWHQLHSNVST